MLAVGWFTVVMHRSWKNREPLGMLSRQKPQSLRSSGSNSRLTLLREKGANFAPPFKS